MKSSHSGNSGSSGREASSADLHSRENAYCNGCGCEKPAGSQIEEGEGSGVGPQRFQKVKMFSQHQASRACRCKRVPRGSMNGVPISASAMTSRHSLKWNYAAWRCSPRRSRPHVTGRHISHDRMNPLTPILALPFRSLERFSCSRYTDIDFQKWLL